MRYHSRHSSLALAAIPFLLLSSSQEAGIRTHVFSDGSGERAVWARSAPGRAEEVNKHLQTSLPGPALTGREQEGDRVLVWRDAQLANLGEVREVEAHSAGIVQAPLSLFTIHTYRETLSFDRGEATDVELHGLAQAKLKYIVQMPGTITSQTPPGRVEGGVVEWDVSVGPESQVFTVESRTLRWPYLVLWIWVLLFLLSKVAIATPRVIKWFGRKPRKI